MNVFIKIITISSQLIIFLFLDSQSIIHKLTLFFIHSQKQRGDRMEQGLKLN